jgi:hypothetical protein
MTRKEARFGQSATHILCISHPQVQSITFYNLRVINFVLIIGGTGILRVFFLAEVIAIASSLLLKPFPFCSSQTTPSMLLSLFPTSCD